MKIRLNGAWRELSGAAGRDDAVRCEQPSPGGMPSLAAVLEQLGYDAALVATAVNGEFVPVRARAEVSVRDGDRIEVLAPMQGG